LHDCHATLQVTVSSLPAASIAAAALPIAAVNVSAAMA
jgi:hypothetical protein